MEIDEAIKQLDWYFEMDDGTTADRHTIDAYNLVRDIAMDHMVRTLEMEDDGK